jgi:hypothetical protein
MSNAPAYKGTGQPMLSQGSGWLGQLGNLLGQGGAPTYHGSGQPVLGTGGLFASAAPAYQQAPAQPTGCGHEEESTMPDGMSTAQAVRRPCLRARRSAIRSRRVRSRSSCPVRADDRGVTPPSQRTPETTQ